MVVKPSMLRTVTARNRSYADTTGSSPSSGEPHRRQSNAAQRKSLDKSHDAIVVPGNPHLR